MKICTCTPVRGMHSSYSIYTKYKNTLRHDDTKCFLLFYPALSAVLWFIELAILPLAALVKVMAAGGRKMYYIVIQSAVVRDILFRTINILGV